MADRVDLEKEVGTRDMSDTDRGVPLKTQLSIQQERRRRKGRRRSGRMRRRGKRMRGGGGKG